MSHGRAPDVALLFPPTWYYVAVPADLTVPAGHLRAAGLTVGTWDLSARAARSLWGDTDGWRALRDPGTYRDPGAHRSALVDLAARDQALGQRWGLGASLRGLAVPELDAGDAVAARAWALDPSRNPLRPVLQAAVDEVRRAAPQVVGITLVHPEQRPHALALAALLRAAGHAGPVVLYGSLEDQLSPLDLAEDLAGSPPHRAFDDLDGALLGEAGPGLLALARGDAEVPGLLRPEGAAPAPCRGPLAAPSFASVAAEDLATPTPVVDLRLGRGCPWGRCAFCAIQAQHPGYRAGSVRAVVAAMADAHATLGSTRFRVRDDLLTPVQLRALATEVATLPFAARWTARARFQPGLTADLLRACASAGLGELWLGLESAAPEVRQEMAKGVDQRTVEAVLAAAAAAGVRVRVLCIAGFPGESPAQARQTVAFLAAHQDRLASVGLTPFALARRSPMASAPARWGLRVVEDRVPRERRLRHTLPFVATPDQQAIMRELPQALPALAPLRARWLGPDPSHAWAQAEGRWD